ncbi:ABC transporter ATP-binding protein [Phyllobacterium endophyticum]|uniref:Polyamine ABC transporter ATP-binding protein n=1 Tax=Phyllobacterium endophyticum TaxID=1149773 RepID=A0A2P7AKE5_9HYPH|nr:ABC transporter ATP-binding protein [Phyllobacterium endophyticum]MBB3237097.1 ABC-type Fe3+/spermidine/putrescine transport system ATPase subunit [Phyllobacterium endophyticum]PSH54667.1 polyamine ABC transporter ATP-binding protein [Phyllobacterium endophyticum]TYR40566.1 ABC transporter ATP-binding protein [Phyllobacterium endophyticum]
MSDIRLSKIRKDYGIFTAVADVDLHVVNGEFLTILGPSGSGKTTLLALIAGLSGPTGGQMHIGSQDVTYTPPQGRNIGLVFQSYALFPHMTVAENVAFPLEVRKWSRSKKDEAVGRVLQMMQLGALSSRKPSQLSGGQQQRVALARAIVFQPNILLLDEPLGALDKKLREELQVELKQLQRRLGITTLLVTHDQEEALSMGDRVMILNEGKVQQIATPEIAYLQPANRFVAEFLGTANIVSVSDGSSRKGILRPERLLLRTSAGTNKGVATVVSDLVYLGQTVRYYLSAADGTSFIAVRPFVGPKFALGSAVNVSWTEEDVWPID